MRKKGYRLLAGLLCIGLLSGCGGNAGGSDGKGSGGNSAGGDAQDTQTGDGAAADLSNIYTGELEQNVTIRVLENDTAIEQGYFQELIDAFNEAYAEYGIVAVDANMDQYSNLADDGPYGYGPDVLYQANDVLMKYVDGKHIYPIPVQDMECYAQIPERAWEAYRREIDGVTYYMAVPVNVQTSMLYYRKDLLPDNWETAWDDDGNGIPDMVESWNEMYRFSKLRMEENEGQYGYMRSMYDVYFSSGFLFSYGGYVFGNNNTDPSDLGFSAGDSWMGASVLLQQASLMNEGCIDDTITVNAYSKLADGTYFATMTTRGELVTQDGDFVLGGGGRHIRLDPNEPVTINRMGEIYQGDAYVDTIMIADFADYNYLERYGENYFQPVDGAELIPANSEVYSGYLEMANMSVVTEMVNMITIQRQYEANQKVITTYDSTLDAAVNQTGKV